MKHTWISCLFWTRLGLVARARGSGTQSQVLSSALSWHVVVFFERCPSGYSVGYVVMPSPAYKSVRINWPLVCWRCSSEAVFKDQTDLRFCGWLRVYVLTCANPLHTAVFTRQSAWSWNLPMQKMSLQRLLYSSQCAGGKKVFLYISMFTLCISSCVGSLRSSCWWSLNKWRSSTETLIPDFSHWPWLCRWSHRHWISPVTFSIIADLDWWLKNSFTMWDLSLRQWHRAACHVTWCVVTEQRGL